MFCFGGVVVYCRTLASTGSGKTRAAELFWAVNWLVSLIKFFV
jgi:hypothetical protein